MVEVQADTFASAAGMESMECKGLYNKVGGARGSSSYGSEDSRDRILA
jgi:hypothetical protein